MVKNDFFAEMDALDEPGKTAVDFMPVQAEGHARIADDPDGSKGSYTAGTGSGIIRDVKSSAEIIQDIMEEAEKGMANMREVFTS